MKIGLYEKAISNQFNWEEKILLAKQAGFNFMEISIDESNEKIARLDWTEEQFQQMRKLLAKHNFYFQSLCLSAHRKFPLGSNDPLLVEQAFIIFKKALVFAKKLDIKLIQLAGYDVYYEKSDKKTIKQFAKNLLLITKQAAKLDIILALETMDKPLIGTCKKALKFIRPLSVKYQKYLQIYPDIGNTYQWLKTKKINTGIQNMTRDFLYGFNYIVQIHIKQTTTNTFRDVPWTKGDVPFVDIFYFLKKLNYSMDFVIEMWAEKDCNYTFEQQLKILQNSLTFVQNQMHQGGWKTC